ncbi:uncharacterized protein Dyrk3 isoform X2 [Bactrocera oleae]|uniref:uncharacterized protein Dyrk3 isoform X2 n=1 Tax=Bactrocera oleae TaxID=104688 RepID=UPI00387EE33B
MYSTVGYDVCNSIPITAGSMLPELTRILSGQGLLFRRSNLVWIDLVSSRLSLSSLEQRLAAGLLCILLTHAGIKSNPGPEEFYCCVCARRLHPNSTSVRCNTCSGWSHLKTCSGLKTHREWTTSYEVPCCQRNTATYASTAVQPAPCSRTAPPLQSSGQDRTSTALRSSHRQHDQPSSSSNPRARATQKLMVPRTVCSVCQTVTRRNVISVKCNSCTGWCHFLSCSGLRTTREWSASYVAPCCRSLPPQTHTVALPINTIVRQTRLLQFNCNGLQSKIEEIVAFMSQERVSIAAVQETKLNSRSDLLSCASFNVLRKDRGRDNGGGLAFILHNTVQYRLIDVDIDRRDSTLEFQGIAVRSGDVELEIFNIYIPPVTCFPTGYHPNIDALLRGENRLLLGDFNAHHDLWHSCLSNDCRGMELAQQIYDSTFCAMNDEAPTRIMGTCNISPDITIASGGLINSITWRPMLTLASDHLLIIISIEKPPDFISVDNRLLLTLTKLTGSASQKLPRTSSTHYPFLRTSSLAAKGSLLASYRLDESRNSALFPSRSSCTSKRARHLTPCRSL